MLLIKNVFFDKQAKCYRVDYVANISSQDCCLQYHTKYYYEEECPQEVKDWLDNGSIQKKVDRDSSFLKAVIGEVKCDNDGNLAYVEKERISA